MLYQHAIRVATVSKETSFGCISAHHFEPTVTLDTRAAAPRGIDHDWSKLGMHASDFVTEHHRQRAGKDPFDHMQV
jgi:hypothetical protein